MFIAPSFMRQFTSKGGDIYHLKYGNYNSLTKLIRYFGINKFQSFASLHNNSSVRLRKVFQILCTTFMASDHKYFRKYK